MRAPGTAVGAPRESALRRARPGPACEGSQPVAAASNSRGPTPIGARQCRTRLAKRARGSQATWGIPSPFAAAGRRAR
eukprot:5755465-Pyramimonas_sp.AAC.1